MMKVPTRLIWKTSTCLTLPSLARSTWYAQAAATRPDRAPPAKRGPKTALSDEALVAAIRAVLAVSPFTGEGYRKVWAKLRAEPPGKATKPLACNKKCILRSAK